LAFRSRLGLSNLEFWLAAEQARECPSLAWSMCQLEHSVAFCLQQEGFLSGFELGQSQFHPVHVAPLSLLERAPLIGLARS
jgi:ribosomal protein S8